MNFSITTNSLSDLPQAACKLLEFSGTRKIILFFGEMGAGKTTLIKEICKKSGVEETVNSPTFALVNEYKSGAGKIYHFDFYRLKNETEAMDIGFEEYLYSGNYCFIEWPEKVISLLPQETIKVHIRYETAHLTDERRVITYSK